MDASVANHVSREPEVGPLAASAHRAFEINEILFSVLRNCSKQTLTCCVRVSRQWLEGSLEILWREVTNLEDLLRPLGEIVERSREIKIYNFNRGQYDTEVEKSYEFSSMLTHKQWLRFQQYYASRIRILRFALKDDHKRKTLCLINLLRNVRFSGPILPNLRTIHWDNLIGKGLEEPFLAFAHEGVQQLILKDTGNHSLGKLIALEAIPSCMPELTDLAVQLPLATEYFSPLTRVIKEFPSLQSLKVSCYDLEILPFINHPRLKVLRILSQPSMFNNPVTPWIYFPTLETFEIDCTYASASRIFYWKLPCLTMIRITCANFDGKHADVQNILSKISAYCPCITQIEVTMRKQIAFGSLFMAGNQLNLDTFHPILTNPSISSFIIRHTFFLDIGPQDITTISSAWPRLKSLYLCCDPMHAASPNIGLQELFPFALNCPDLEELGLFIDANFSDTLAASDWRVPPTSFRKLRVLDVGKSAIAKGAERAVARFLSLVCTPGCVIKYHDPSNKDNLVAEQWKVVNDMLPQLFSLRVWYERRMAYELERAGNPCN